MMLSIRARWDDADLHEVATRRKHGVRRRPLDKRACRCGARCCVESRCRAAGAAKDFPRWGAKRGGRGAKTATRKCTLRAQVRGADVAHKPCNDGVRGAANRLRPTRTRPEHCGWQWKS